MSNADKEVLAFLMWVIPVGAVLFGLGMCWWELRKSNQRKGR